MDQFELRGALLFGLLARRLHGITRRACVSELMPSAEPDSCLAPFGRNATSCWWRWVGIDLLRSAGAITGGRREIRGVGGENLTGGNITRKLQRSTS